MKKIVWLSDSPFTNTGYATISRNILNGVSDEFETHFLAHNFPGQTIPAKNVMLKDGFRFDFTTHGVGREAYCKDIIVPKLQILKADIFVILLDTFMVYPWIMDMNFAPAKSVFYFPSDGGGGLPQDCDRLLKHFQYPVAMSKFAQRQAKEQHAMDVGYIPHAVDQNVYRPLDIIEKEQLRKEFEVVSLNGNSVKGFLWGKYVVGTVARNQGRKMLDRTIKAFAEFCKDKPDAVLYMHSDPYDGAAVFDIKQLIIRYNLENRVCFSNMRYFENFEYKDMIKVYNVMDVFLLTTSGEGFGVPTIEAMACEIPCVVTDYTTTQELLIDDGVCGIAVPLAAELTGNWVVERALMDLGKCAEALTHLYKDRSYAGMLGVEGRKKVLRQYTWDVVLPQWKELFKRMTA